MLADQILLLRFTIFHFPFSIFLPMSVWKGIRQLMFTSQADTKVSKQVPVCKAESKANSESHMHNVSKLHWQITLKDGCEYNV